MIEQKCTGCGEPKPDDGMRLCVTCSRLVDDVFDEIGFDPESVIADSTTTRKP